MPCSIGAEGACRNSQVKGQRQTKNTFEKKVFFACFFSAQNGEWARKAGRFRRK